MKELVLADPAIRRNLDFVEPAKSLRHRPLAQPRLHQGEVVPHEPRQGITYRYRASPIDQDVDGIATPLLEELKSLPDRDDHPLAVASLGDGRILPEETGGQLPDGHVSRALLSRPGCPEEGGDDGLPRLRVLPDIEGDIPRTDHQSAVLDLLTRLGSPGSDEVSAEKRPALLAVRSGRGIAVALEKHSSGSRLGVTITILPPEEVDVRPLLDRGGRRNGRTRRRISRWCRRRADARPDA